MLTLKIFSCPGQRVLSQVHQVGQPREGHLQAGGQQGCVPAVGAAQEQARHELRDHGPRSQVCKSPGQCAMCDPPGHFLLVYASHHSLSLSLSSFVRSSVFSKRLYTVSIALYLHYLHLCILQVLLPEGYPRQGGRPEAGVPVRGCSQDWRHCGGGLRRRLSRDT